MSEVPLYPLSGEGVIFDPQQVVGAYVCPTVGAYGPTRHLRDRAVSPTSSRGGLVLA